MTTEADPTPCPHRMIRPASLPPEEWKPVLIRCPDCDKMLLKDEIEELIAREKAVAIVPVPEPEKAPEPEPKRTKSLGQIGYEAYCGHTGGKSLISGAPLPLWHEQRSDMGAAWAAVGLAVATAALEAAKFALLQACIDEPKSVYELFETFDFTHEASAAVQKRIEELKVKFRERYKFNG